MRIPDLWRINEDVPRLYLLYLNRLRMNGSHERILTASRQIRRHATRGPGLKAGLFTFSFEIDALCELGQYQAAWRQLRRWEEIARGRRIDLGCRTWSADELAMLEFHHIPLFFFKGQYRQGCRLLEAVLDVMLDERKARSYDLMFHIYNRDREPTNLCRVTLTHYYARLGKDLRQWPRWESFVNGFHPRLFRLAGIRPEEIVADPRRLAAFYERLLEIRSERTRSGITGGERDLTDSAKAVEKRQIVLQEKLDRFREGFKSRSQFLDTKLLELFPELRDLGKR